LKSLSWKLFFRLLLNNLQILRTLKKFSNCLHKSEKALKIIWPKNNQITLLPKKMLENKSKNFSLILFKLKTKLLRGKLLFNTLKNRLLKN